MKFAEDSIQGKQQTALLDNFEFEPEILKTGKVDQVLKKNESILIQILKEPISTKGPRLSCEITIPGRFIVLTPFSNTIAVSKKSQQPGRTQAPSASGRIDQAQEFRHHRTYRGRRKESGRPP